MRIFGSSQNMSLFRKSILTPIDKAGLDYMKALPFLEVYLGGVFAHEAADAKENQIYETEIDSFFEFYGEKAVTAHLNISFWRKLGQVIQRHYFPDGSERWNEVELLLGRKLDKDSSSAELVGQLLRHAVAKDKEIVQARLTRAGKEVSEVVEFNPHLWRAWFYNLWGQTYEWGYLQTNNKMAEANGQYYQFSIPPQRLAKITVISVKELLEAHNFCVVTDEEGALEYWR